MSVRFSLQRRALAAPVADLTKLVVTHDIFRSRDCGLLSVAENARWLHAMLGVTLHGRAVEVNLASGTADGGSIDVAAALARLAVSPNLAGWARLVSMGDLGDVPELATLTDADFVVGFGLTPSLINTIDRAGLPLLDIEISPLRFGRSKFFRARTNRPDLASLLETIGIDRDEIAQDVQSFVGRAARSSVCCADRPSIGVVLGQAHIDLSIVGNGELCSLEDDAVLARIAELASDVDELHLLPHPSVGLRPGNMHRLIEAIPNAVLERRRVYPYFVSGSTKFVTSLSSGALAEAAAFGIPAIGLMVPDRDRRDLLPRCMSEWVDVHDGLFAPSFWRRIVSGGLDNAAGQRLASRLVADALGAGEAAGWFAEPVHSLPRPAVGDRLVPAGAGTCRNAFRFGWHDPEPWGVWSAADYASIAFRVDSLPAVRIRIALQVLQPRPDAVPEIHYTTSASCEFLPLELAPGDPDPTLELTIDTRTSGGVVSVTFHNLAPCSPAALGMSDDERRLGIGVRWIEIVADDVPSGAGEARTRGLRDRSDGYYETLHRTNGGYQTNNWLLPYVWALGRLAPGSVVECGCGNGAFVEAMAAFAKRVVGLDWAPSPLFPHSRRGVEFRRWNAWVDAVPAADLVCSADFLEHMPADVLDSLLDRITSAGPRQFHIVACYDDFHSHLTIEPPAFWLDRFNAARPGFRLLDAPVRAQGREIAVITNIDYGQSGWPFA